MKEYDHSMELTPAYLECEQKMLEHSGIPLSEFKVYNVEIDDQGHYVRTYEVGFNNDGREGEESKK
jgi:hypothetical protein